MANGGADTGSSARTAAAALLAGMPGLAVTAVAVIGSNALTVRADLLLSLLDVMALAGVCFVTRSGGGVLRERLASALVALSMAASLALISYLAFMQLSGGGTRLEGFGLFLALALNGGYAVFNAWALRRWQGVLRHQPSPLAHSQVRLFSDKLSSNLLISLSLAMSLVLDGSPISLYADPAAGLALALATAWWAAPTIAAAVRDLAGLLAVERRYMKSGIWLQ
ncbi:MAG TPA: hypothetical protein VHL31_09595 [Geminicoccus sp.]|uniref:hypothetical protein n=1 Tax=Geminicoccus sp. TaxID=2024832 RepID=UPI002E30E905|nr:hypothetical protein [Geminicoccus sp.]HEX2526534.1 hypothetical protein [Geminicoccus sp.]